ncbi:hypothetical protein BV20DRAFT_1058364 [Pilatotrama ljubarskyi]|nr:hypothetical protein BV20DRAFT_1058364 [Pilatotrama ljubarskyi]
MASTTAAPCKPETSVEFRTPSQLEGELETTTAVGITLDYVGGVTKDHIELLRSKTVLLQLELAVLKAQRATDRTKIEHLERDITALRESSRELVDRLQRMGRLLEHVQVINDVMQARRRGSDYRLLLPDPDDSSTPGTEDSRPKSRAIIFGLRELCTVETLRHALVTCHALIIACAIHVGPILEADLMSAKKKKQRLCLCSVCKVLTHDDHGTKKPGCMLELRKWNQHKATDELNAYREDHLAYSASVTSLQSGNEQQPPVTPLPPSTVHMPSLDSTEDSQQLDACWADVVPEPNTANHSHDGHSPLVNADPIADTEPSRDERDDSSWSQSPVEENAHPCS